MEIKINDINASEKEIEVTLAYTEIKDELVSEIKKKIKDIQIAGFRKGKAPLPFIKKIYGDALDYEASEKVANNRFWDIIKEKQLNPIDTPTITDIKFKPEEDLYFKIRFEILPEIEIKDYTGHEIEVPKVAVRKEDVDYEIKAILNANRVLQDDEIIGEGKDYLLTVNLIRLDDKGNEIEGTLSEKIQIDFLNERVQPEIIERSRGKKRGEKFTFTFSDERTVKNLKGEDEKVTESFTYSAEIIEIKKIVLPDLNEEFVKKVTKNKVSSEEELRKNISEDIKRYLDNQVDQIIRSRLMDVVLKNNEFEPPHSMVHRYLDELVRNEEEQAKKTGNKKFNRQEISRNLHGVAEMQLRWHMLQDSLVKKENISVSDDDLNELAEKEAQKTGITVDKLLNYYKSTGYKNKLTDQKVFDFLKNNNSVKYVESKEKGQEIHE